jgi:hypothetical protein
MPAWLDRIIPRLSVEGAADDDPPVVTTVEAPKPASEPEMADA